MLKFKWNLQLFAGEEEVIETGANTEELADLSNDETEHLEDSEEEVEEAEELDSEEEEVEETEDGEDKHPLENSKAFAERLKKKTEKIEQQLKDQYGPYYKVIEREAKKYDMTPEEYVAELDRLAEEEAAEKAAEEAKAKAEKYKGLTEEEIADLEWAKANKPKVELANKYQEQAAAFKKEFPNVDPKSIPDDVYRQFDLYGVPYTETYKLLTKVQGNAAQTKIQAEQEAIRKLQEIKSPGSLTGNGAEDKPRSVNDMTSTEFQAYLEKVKRGEI